MENSKVIFGNELLDAYKNDMDNAVVNYWDRTYPKQVHFSLNYSMLSRHLLLLGGAGSGKTNVFKLTMTQLREKASTNDVFIIFDTKGDFYEGCGKDMDLILGNSKEYREKSQRWNIYDEVLADGENPEDYEVNAREIAASLFEDRGSSSQPFFSNAARDIFAHALIYFIREAVNNPADGLRKLNNKSLTDFLLNANGSDYEKMFNKYSDMKGVMSYLGDGTSNQALGVLGELKSMLYDLFIGVFNDNDMHGRFSMRDSVRKKQGRAIFIEYDLMTGETLTPIYRLLVDLALKEALGRSDSEGGNVYMILDELKLLPKLKHMDDALNFGRGKGVKVIAGLQSINQLYDIYGEAKGKVIAGGFSTLFAFHTSDNESREYVSKLFGTNVVGYHYTGIDGVIEKREREGYAVETWDQSSLNIGEAVIGLADNENPFLFQFTEYKDR